MDAEFWNERYAGDAFVYGEKPNAFLVEMAARIPSGPVLCLAEGEGRNAVYLAERGHAVTAVDQSAIGLAKAKRLASTRGISIETVVADLSNYRILQGSWSGVVAIFAHLPPVLRQKVFSAAVQGLRVGGVFVLEAYAPAQLGLGTGGPKSLDLLVSVAALREELAGLKLEIAREIEREVVEGCCHNTGRAAVVQVLGTRAS